jgi:RNA polymerase sigma-70 factor (ECF subfamily)
MLAGRRSRVVGGLNLYGSGSVNGLRAMRGSAPLPQPRDGEDLHLVEAFLAGEESAFDALVRRYQVLAYRVARGVVGTHADADDVAQEAFLRAYRNLKTFRREASFRTWLLRIVTHTALNHRRSWWVRRQVDTEVDRLEQAGSPDGADEQMLDGERRRLVREAIQALPERQRETVRMRLEGSRNYARIAEEMGVSVGTVKANFHHAVRNLRRALAAQDGGAAGDGAEDESP